MEPVVLRHTPTEYSELNVVQASKCYPQWYKDAPVYPKDDTSEIAKGSFKKCSPFTDSFSLGYMLPLQKDVHITFINGERKISSFVAANPVLQRSTAVHNNPTLPVPSGFCQEPFAWLTKNIIHIPEGYRALITHPLNRYDLPFITLTAVLNGEFTLQPGSVPMFLKEDFEGTIPAGTPIAQIILFKDEDWVSEIDSSLIETVAKREEEHGQGSFTYNKLARKPAKYQ